MCESENNVLTWSVCGGREKRTKKTCANLRETHMCCVQVARARLPELLLPATGAVLAIA